MSFASKIECQICGNSFDLEAINFCPDCGRPGQVDSRNWTLEIDYDWDKIKKDVKQDDLLNKSSLWRYLPLLPVEDKANITSLGEGNTPLAECKNLEKEFGIEELYIKDETRNPTGSFKDRMVSVIFQKAVELNTEKLLFVSDGNLGSSGAAYCGKEGNIDCLIMTYPHITNAKLLQMLIHGGEVFDIRGSLQERVNLFQTLGERDGWFIANNDHIGNPYAVEGYKTIAYEIAEQREWVSPDHVIVPTGSGEGISGVYKGFRELFELGWINKIPRIHGAQVAGNDPLVRAVEKDSADIEPLAEMRPTIVGGINTDITGYTALTSIKESGGYGVTTEDKESLAGERLMAMKEAVYTEPASGAAMYGIKKLLNQGIIKRNESAVCVVTSYGLKALNATEKIVDKPHKIEADLNSFDSVLNKE